MHLTITCAPLVDGVLDSERCFCRPACLYSETVEPEDQDDDGVRTFYFLPNGRDVSEFTVIDLSQAEAVELAERLKAEYELV